MILHGVQKYDEIDVILLPLHYEKHWSLGCIYPKKYLVSYIDSIISELNQEREQDFFDFAKLLLKNLLKEQYDDKKKWILSKFEKNYVPHQENDCECGLYVCWNASWIG